MYSTQQQLIDVGMLAHKGFVRHPQRLRRTAAAAAAAAAAHKSDMYSTRQLLSDISMLADG
jgi:hypothetical protein